MAEALQLIQSVDGNVKIKQRQLKADVWTFLTCWAFTYGAQRNNETTARRYFIIYKICGNDNTFYRACVLKKNKYKLPMMTAC